MLVVVVVVVVVIAAVAAAVAVAVAVAVVVVVIVVVVVPSRAVEEEEAEAVVTIAVVVVAIVVVVVVVVVRDALLSIMARFSCFVLHSETDPRSCHTSQIQTSAKREVLAESLGDDAERSISSSEIRSTQSDDRCNEDRLQQG